MSANGAFPPAALDVLLPLHLRVSASGRIVHAGPTLLKLRPAAPILGRRFLEVFCVRRPCSLASETELRAHARTRLHLNFRDPPETGFKGVLVPVDDNGDMLINLSFGISFVEALRDYSLHSSDFAPTDLTIEMLYLLEAKSAVLEESRRLNTRLAAARIAAEEQAYTDTLTGLKNRRAMDHVLERYIDRATPFSLIQLDLDFFKSVNDTLGHAAGDRVLQEVARLLVDETRDYDTVVRIGGDEFVIILPDMTEERALIRLSRRIIARLEQPISFGGETCRISASAGIVVSGWYARPVAERLLADADAALYRSKDQGRGRVNLADARSPLETECRAAPEPGAQMRTRSG